MDQSADYLVCLCLTVIREVLAILTREVKWGEGIFAYFCRM